MHTSKSPKSALEAYFEPFRKNIIGIDQSFVGPYGEKKIIYADWTASGRLYAPIEERLSRDMGALVANTHTETSYTGKMMTLAYHEAKSVIKNHVNANAEDVLIPSGTGMTGAVSKFQRLLGLKVPEQVKHHINLPSEERPVVFITHMEHHSNQTSWLETLAQVEIIEATPEGLVSLSHLKELVSKYAGKRKLIASITGCSNVTGIETPYHEIARIMHQAGGVCFVDFACSGPYVQIDMHPENDPEAKLDAIFFSPHKFLGGPGTPGMLIFSSRLYTNKVPDIPGGGTVTFTNPWGKHYYINDIETREDGGTPGFLQTIKAALAIRLKEEMGIENIRAREDEILEIIFNELSSNTVIKILAGNTQERLGVLSFAIEGLHYNLGVSMLNDRYGIQTRGGCSCAGTYGHYLLELDEDASDTIAFNVQEGNFRVRPGWIRASFHPTMTNAEVQYICKAIKEVAENWQSWQHDYIYTPATNEFKHKTTINNEQASVQQWFAKSLKL